MFYFFSLRFAVEEKATEEDDITVIASGSSTVDFGSGKVRSSKRARLSDSPKHRKMSSLFYFAVCIAGSLRSLSTDFSFFLSACITLGKKNISPVEAAETETVIDLLQALQTERRQLYEERRLEDKELDGKFSECFARLKLACKPKSD